MNVYYVAFCILFGFGQLRVGQSKVPNDVGVFCAGRLKTPVLTKLTDLLETMKTDPLKKEFSQIPKGQRYDWNTALKNKEKNRYEDNLAYDRSRVKLGKDGYINANYVPGYSKTNQYIATQGPMENTAADFWKMVWDNKASQIVVLTNSNDEEKETFSRYWPEKATHYGNIEVIPKEYQLYLVQSRLFTVKYNEKTLTVLRYHFTDWPQRKVPDAAEPLVKLVKAVRSKATAKDAPLVVLSSGGMGRTGTFILVDSIIKHAMDVSKTERDALVKAAKQGKIPKNYQSVDFAQQLCKMRENRINLVETVDQYLYAHQVVALWAKEELK